MSLISKTQHKRKTHNMSSYICNDAHFHYLAAAWKHYTKDNHHSDDPIIGNRYANSYDSVGKRHAHWVTELYHANYQSVTHRYTDGTQYELESILQQAYRWPHWDHLQVIESINCYQYQCSDAPEWPESAAKRMTDKLRLYVVNKMLDDRRDGPRPLKWGCPEPVKPGQRIPSGYSRPVTIPKTKQEGLANAVQFIVNYLEKGDTREALLSAVDLLQDVECESNPYRIDVKAKA